MARFSRPPSTELVWQREERQYVSASVRSKNGSAKSENRRRRRRSANVEQFELRRAAREEGPEQADAKAKPIEKLPTSIMANISINFVMKATYASKPLFISVEATEPEGEKK